jgi:beta-galactosidase
VAAFVDSAGPIWLTAQGPFDRHAVLMPSRRQFLTRAAALAAVGAASAPSASSESSAGSGPRTQTVDLCGTWKFRCDPDGRGVAESWQKSDHPAGDWQQVQVPHTWQVDPLHADYRGVAWYRRVFEPLPGWRNGLVRIEFEAVFHSATVWVNGQRIGEHARKGYTAFTFDVTPMIRWDAPGTIAVRVDNAFDQHMLPRGRSSDWATDGGIFRPVRFLITPGVFVEQVDIEAVPDFSRREAALTISARCRNASTKAWAGAADFRVVDQETGLTVPTAGQPASLSLDPQAARLLVLKTILVNPKLWHFDSPRLYRLEFSIANGDLEHEYQTTFGIRRLEVHNGGLQLNGEPVRLMGVERMAGSHPQFGMAEPCERIEHDLRDLKDLNCIFTRVHWPQDKRVLDYCDRHGILLQTEVPAWGADTFDGMGAEPDADIMENGLQQLREMIARDRNHPSVVVWGLCNEIDGQNPAAYQFAKRLLEEAKRLDPGRLCSYASNSLGRTPERDVAGLMDLIETNEYFGTWEPGTAEDAGRHLDRVHQAFPEKPIVISEYGYCACTPERPEGDQHRIEILQTHNAVIRARDYVAGAIFFCYNDYRTHVGDRGVGALQQRVHGVTDVYGARKPSYALLREESSPIESLRIGNDLNNFHVLVRTRRDLPMHQVRGYKLVGRFYGQGNIPLELKEADLSDMAPGAEVKVDLSFAQSGPPAHVQFDVLRSTRFSVFTLDWMP